MSAEVIQFPGTTRSAAPVADTGVGRAFQAASEAPSIPVGTDELPGNVNMALVRSLEAALESAKSGKLQSFVGAGFSSTGNRQSIYCEAHPNVFAFYGSLKLLADEYLRRHPEIAI